MSQLNTQYTMQITIPRYRIYFSVTKEFDIDTFLPFLFVIIPPPFASENQALYAPCL